MPAGDPFGADPSEDPDEEAPLPEEVGSGPWVKVLVAVTLVALVGLGVAIVVALRDEGHAAGATLVVDEAVDTRVILACRVAAVAEAGLRMPENTLVETGPEGHFEAGGVVMGPNRQAIVVHGELEVRRRGTEIGSACDT